MTTKKGFATRLSIRTRIAGFTPAEWAQIWAAAAYLGSRGGDAATLLLPGRPEVFRLERQGNRFWLRLTDEEELAETLRAEARARREALL